MLNRVSVSLFLALLTTLVLFWLMSHLIRSDGAPIEDVTYEFPVVDFIRLPEEEPPLTGRKPKPERVEPPPLAPKIKPSVTQITQGHGISYKPPKAPIKNITVAQSSVVPLMIIQPEYSQRHINKGTQGYVVIGFTVSRYGTVIDPYVIESHPKGVFDSAALRAIEKSKFKPRMVDGAAIDSSGFQYRYVFEIES